MSAIRAGDAAGVIFFGDNISSLAQIRAVIGQLQAASLSSPLHKRLLTLVDQEGGLVRRLPGAPALSEKEIGEATNPAAVATDAGAAAGRELAGVGINVNLAPVLDVFRQPDDFTDHFRRSYSSDPGLVSTLGAAFITAQQRTGVAATAKHFPGLGAASEAQNTDLQPVDLNLPLAALRGTDELPYRSAISQGVSLVMLSWATYPALDAHLPAGLSPQVIQHELRGRLGFSGLTITDAIDAGAARPFGSLAQRSIRAAAAGEDLILCATPNSPNTPQLGAEVLHALASAIQTNELNRADAQRAAAAVLALRSRL